MSTIDPNQWKHRGKTLKFEGHSIFYKDEGKGTVLLCIHGFPTSSWDWHKVWPQLTQNYRVVAPDLLGFGFSEKPSRHAYSLKEQASIIEALLNKLSIKEVHILAHDYGVSVAQELLARHHERKKSRPTITSVCFLNGGLFPETHRPRFIQKLLLSPLGGLVGLMMTKGRFEKSFCAVFGANTQPDKEELAHFWRLIRTGGGRKIIHRLIHYIPERAKNRERWVGALQRTSVPLRLINGPLDPVSGMHMAERYREMVPNSDIVYIEDCGHYPQVEKPEATLRAYSAFMKRILLHN